MLGEIIYFYRNERGITQEELARGICSVSYLSKLENGKIDPNKEVLRDLLKKLGLSMEDIMEEDEQLTSLLDEWKELILSRKADLATQKKKEIEILIANKMVNPMVLRSNLTLEIGYQLLTKNVQRATEVHSTVEVFLKYLTVKQQYLYHQFTGLLFYESNDMIKCLEALLVGLDVGENNQVIRPDLYYQLALVYSRLYQIPICVYYAEKALALFDQASDYIRSTDCKILLGINHNRLSNFQKAEFYLQSALKFANSYGTPHLTSIVLHNLGFLYSAKLDRKLAINYYLDSLKIRDENDVNRYLNTLYYLAKEYYSYNERNSAIEWIQKGLVLASSKNIELYRIKLTYLLYKINDDNEVDFIEFMEKQAIPYFQRKGDYLYISEYAETLADFFTRQFYYKKSSYYYSLSNEARKKINGMVISV